MKLQVSGLLPAMFVTPVLPALAYGVWGFLFPDTRGEYLLAFAVWSAIGYIYSFMLVSILGVPTFLLARHFRLDRWWLALIAGAVVGMVISTEMRLGPLALFAPLGAACGTVFWFIAARNAAQQNAPEDALKQRASER